MQSSRCVRRALPEAARRFLRSDFSRLSYSNAPVAVGVLLRGTSLMDYARQFATAPGMIYAALLIAFGLMPWATQRD
jgi:hypothetical protein